MGNDIIPTDLYPGVFYAVLIALVLLGLLFSVQIFQCRMSWGKARFMGISMIAFSWMNIIYYLVLFEGVYGFVGFILDLPFWIDVFLFLVVFVLSMMVYFMLIHREKFKPMLFTTSFLLPLSIPGLPAAVKLIPQKAPAEILQTVPTGVPAKAIPSFPRQQKIGDSGYEVEFQNSHEKGKFGDWLTAEQLTTQGFVKENSKLDKVHGIDGVYVRYEKSARRKIQEILIVENKVDSAQLQNEQMTEEWIENRVGRMFTNDETRPTAGLIWKNLGLVRKELWHHDLDTGVTTIKTLDDEANAVPDETRRIGNSISDLVRKRCESQKPTIVCIPASQ